MLDRIVANAQRAPSAGFSQGWAFLVLSGKDETERYWNATMSPERRTDFGWPGMFNAGAIIVCLSNKSEYLRRYAREDKGWTDMDEKRWPVPYWDIDAGMAALLILQTATDAGLGSCFIGVPPDKDGAVRAAFGVPDDHDPVGVITIGHRAEGERSSGSPRTRRRRELGELVHHGSWGQARH